ncbi:MAG: hypothetical protein ACFB2W_26480 [Leptolyngbyaceae cyanobacterium]
MAEQNKQTTPAPSGGKQTPLEETSRTTGSGTKIDAKSSAEPEAPGDGNSDVAGDPNQGTEAR